MAQIFFWIELIAVLSSLAYIFLASVENPWCWPASMLGVALTIYICFDQRLYSELVLNTYYMGVAVYGWMAWRRSATRSEAEPSLRITSTDWKNHLWWIPVLLLLSALTGWAMQRWLGANAPYLDALVSWFSVLATWMTARKILETWLYWVVVDALAAYLYFSRELYLFGWLFVIYTLMAAYAYIRWRRSYLQTC